MEVDFSVDSCLMRDYLFHLFRYGGKGPVRVDGSTAIGRLMAAHVRQCASRPDRPSGGIVITLDFGMNAATQSLKDKWLYYQAGDMKQINAALRSWFDIDLYSFYLKAEGMGYSKKEIIEAFIESRGLSDIDPYDTLYKRIYRKELARQRDTVKILKRRIYYLLETVDMGGLSHEESH